jgi:23S rRNA (cytidine1920-2'-O)/16S rRNA (cytidine1409-2'-O)-methyltransferase
MVRRGLAASRAEAAMAVGAGRVLVGGRPARKSGALVAGADAIAFTRPARKFASRGGEKLEAALDRFAVDVVARSALDAGASTGGFTDCLLSRGATSVVAVDVGYGQLDWRLRTDPRVSVLERTNARYLHPEMLPGPPEVVTADLSFISLELVVPALAECAADAADFVLLVKPQFEAGREAVGAGGVVRSRDDRRRAVERVAAACRRAGLAVRGVMASPLVGPAGNAELLLWAARPAHDAPGFADDLEHALDEAADLSGLQGHGVEPAPPAAGASP